MVLHAGEGDDSVAWRCNDLVEYLESIGFAKVELLQFVFNESLAGFLERLLHFSYAD